jgi:protein-L-isoaspartate(D-aspartate) O-methyltransferase
MAVPTSIETIELDHIRRFYAEEIRVVANLHSDSLTEAFASVPREQYLGPGPWLIRGADADLSAPPRATPNADPRHVYHNVSIVIDGSRQLFNGQPGTLGLWIDALQLKPGERVLHLGCATGYYTAIMAQMVGPAGRIRAVEIDPELARRARENLSEIAWAEVREGDGSCGLPEELDAVLINAGATHPLSVWLDALRLGGRMILPVTFTTDSMQNIGKGGVFLITRQQDDYAARLISMVAIYSCAVARDAAMNERVRATLVKGTWFSVRRLRRDAHDPSPACWLHGSDFCLTA